jgi:WXG100 family type VII secretion target
VDNYAPAAVVHKQARGCLGSQVRCPNEPPQLAVGIQEGTRKMINGLKVSPEQLSSMGGQCSRTAVEVRGQHNALKTQLSPLFGTEWSGAAAAQFAGLYEQFTKSAEGLSAALDGIGRLLGQAGANYAEVEQQIARSFRT